jgi:hypothetical protein
MLKAASFEPFFQERSGAEQGFLRVSRQRSHSAPRIAKATAGAHVIAEQVPEVGGPAVDNGWHCATVVVQ